MGISKFWNSKAIKELYPDLCVIAQWYADMPSSSVAAERVFATMRSMEGDLRARMTRKTVVMELMARVNRWMVTDLLCAELEATRAAADSMPK